MAQTPREIFKKMPLVRHHEIPEIFADQIGMMMFDGNTLRMELAVARMDEPKSPAAQATGERHSVCRLVLSAPCAIDLINQMQQIVAQLTQAGQIKSTAPQAPVTPVTPAEKTN